jgi:hypothetical protein
MHLNGRNAEHNSHFQKNYWSWLELNPNFAFLSAQEDFNK